MIPFTHSRTRIAAHALPLSSRRWIYWATIFCSVLSCEWCWGEGAVAPPLREGMLFLPPLGVDDEASGLLPIQNPTFLEAGWHFGFWIVLDEPPVERAIARLGWRGEDRDTTLGWEIRTTPVSILSTTAKTTSDGEAIARKDDFVYIIGSHFGKKEGLLEPERQFIARFIDSPTSNTIDSHSTIHLEIAGDRFLIHRILNDALKTFNIDTIERGPSEYDCYIRKTLKKKPDGFEKIDSLDRAVNIEGAVFLDNGILLLGLRYPVTRAGHPILVAVRDIDRLFTNEQPSVDGIWILENIGDAQHPTGIRDLMRQESRIHVLTGNLDRYSKKKGASAILEDHPEGSRATSKHYCFTWPPSEAGPNVQAELVRDLAPQTNAEGIAIDPQGNVHYVFDESQVRIRYESPGKTGFAQ